MHRSVQFLVALMFTLSLAYLDAPFSALASDPVGSNSGITRPGGSGGDASGQSIIRLTEPVSPTGGITRPGGSGGDASGQSIIRLTEPVSPTGGITRPGGSGGDSGSGG